MTGPTLLAGSANPSLAEAIARQLETSVGDCGIQRFPDGELRVEVREVVCGSDVYLIQPTSSPVQDHLLELFLLADACRRAGVGRLTAVMPYFGYARQDRRAHGREAVGARLMADLLRASGVQRVVAVDLHSPTLEGFFEFPLEHLTAVPMLAEAVRPHLSARAVVVAPDLGAVKLAERFARLLDLPTAVVHKTRISGEVVQAHGVIGDVRGRAPLIVDDMISTGGTIEAAISAVIAAGGQPEIIAATSHPLLVGSAAERLGAQPIRHLVVTDSVPARDSPLPAQVISLAPLLADVIYRLHRNQSLSQLRAWG